MHGRPAGASQSVLAQRFTEIVGTPPMQFGTVAAVAATVGYESEAAFSRAFKKLVGQSPATWLAGDGDEDERQHRAAKTNVESTAKIFPSPLTRFGGACTY